MLFRSVRATHRERVGPASLGSHDHHLPTAVGARAGGMRLAPSRAWPRRFHGNFLTRVRPAPDRHVTGVLQDHVVCEDTGEAHVAAAGGDQGAGQNDGAEKEALEGHG